MRARLVRPEFWLDEKMAALPVSTRLTYVGLWGLADDGGYLDWNSHEIAAALYRFEPLGRRTKRVDADLEKLVEAGRVRVLECGAHAVIPTLPDHRIKGGEQLYTIQKRHDRRCSVGLHSPDLRRTTSGYVPSSVSSSVSDSVSPDSQSNDEPSEFRSKVRPKFVRAA